MEGWIILVVLAVAAVAFIWGFVVGRSKNSTQRRAQALESELIDLRDHMSDYKQQVGQHFAKTADVVNAMTANYRSLYDQLIKGAQDLCGEQFSQAKLDPAQVRFIEHRGDTATDDKGPGAGGGILKGGPGNPPPLAAGGTAGRADGEQIAAKAAAPPPRPDNAATPWERTEPTFKRDAETTGETNAGDGELIRELNAHAREQKAPAGDAADDGASQSPPPDPVDGESGEAAKPQSAAKAPVTESPTIH